MGGSPGPDYSKDDFTVTKTNLKVVIADAAVFVAVKNFPEVRVSLTDGTVTTSHK